MDQHDRHIQTQRNTTQNRRDTRQSYRAPNNTHTSNEGQSYRGVDATDERERETVSNTYTAYLIPEWSVDRRRVEGPNDNQLRVLGPNPSVRLALTSPEIQAHFFCAMTEWWNGRVLRSCLSLSAVMAMRMPPHLSSSTTGCFEAQCWCLSSKNL